MCNPCLTAPKHIPTLVPHEEEAGRAVISLQGWGKSMKVLSKLVAKQGCKARILTSWERAMP